ncbi:hypothetical protein [Deinococcus marmoris]|uniref:Argininosuccinate lyase n=1 Tax=Deinococcus marmoris TaxID=249408 RepID=A0A1U7P3I6_9DEIO|nr:hypothetical protein [Deinococcus marmoris]OLV19732.1 Argininosuccinate lyase [Deinococcus marmoris]
MRRRKRGFSWGKEWLCETQQGGSVVTELADVIAFWEAHAHIKTLLDHLHPQP